MKKVKLHFARTGLRDNDLIIKLQGFLMERLDSDYVDFLHCQETNPYSMNLSGNREESIWTVNLLTDQAEEEILPHLLAIERIELDGFEKPIVVLNTSIQTLSQDDLLEIFQSDEEADLFHLHFYTPTTFKSQGQYMLFPDTRFIFQSLMQKYSRLLEGKEEIEEETLDFLAEHSRISSYQLRSHYFRVHKQRFPSFQGRLTIKVWGASTLKAYARMLLTFGQYSGVGAKCSLGMGGLEIEERKA